MSCRAQSARLERKLMSRAISSAVKSLAPLPVLGRAGRVGLSKRAATRATTSCISTGSSQTYGSEPPATASTETIAGAPGRGPLHGGLEAAAHVDDHGGPADGGRPGGGQVEVPGLGRGAA